MKNYLIAIAITAVLSAALTRYYFPKVVSKIETQEVVRKDVKTVIKVVERKDGTKETTTEVLDRSTEKKESTSQIFAQSNWLISASYGLHMDRLGSADSLPIYGLQVQRRIFGPVYLGLAASTDKVYSASIGMEF